jgi:two-component system sensor histidine kinase PilS (NtrC family)
VTHVVGVITDLSQVRAAEEELRRARGSSSEVSEEGQLAIESAHQALLRKERLAVLGQLAGGLAHQIRNPLPSISGSVQALRSSVVPGSSEQRLMEIVVSESQRLSSIIEDFLKYVRPRERAIEQVDAAGALRDVVTLLKHSDEVLPTHRIVLDLDPESVTVAADPGQLRQIFWNLARNALAAMPEGGTLTVSSRLNDGRFLASISDEGRGMTAEQRDVLFTPFAHSFPGGTGLGLAIVYRIVEEHGGRIAVETAPNQGTTIRITLPQNSEDALESSSVRRLVIAREVA